MHAHGLGTRAVVQALSDFDLMLPLMVDSGGSRGHTASGVQSIQCNLSALAGWLLSRTEQVRTQDDEVRYCADKE
ncbi:hypothetical protein C8T65DRAFT_662609 [Cerioporus squamosus]|nr:hypothetical protein C8T65DRAFT_662609 [Cerioporus squamosus]